MHGILWEHIRPSPTAETLLRRKAHGEALGVQPEVPVGVQARCRSIPTLGRSRFVTRAGISAGVDLHYELALPGGGMSPEHRVSRHFTGADGTHDERALWAACLVAIRRTAADVSIDKAARRHGAERHHGVI